MKEFTWHASLADGLKEIDNQHKALFALIQQIKALPDTETVSTEFNDLVMEFIDTAKAHFEFEENLLAEAGYPYLTGHTAEHAAIIQSLAEIVASPVTTDPQTMQNSLTSIINWFEEHLHHEDNDYSRFLKEHTASD